MTNSNEDLPAWSGKGPRPAWSENRPSVRQHVQGANDDDLIYAMPPLRPEARDRYFPWFVVGLFFWPLLLVAADYYFKDRRAYEAAMQEYRMGGDPTWYWEGMASSPVNGSAGAPSTKKRSIVGVVVTVLVLLMVVVFLAVVILSFIGSLVGGTSGDKTTIEDLGGGTVILLSWLGQ